MARTDPAVREQAIEAIRDHLVSNAVPSAEAMAIATDLVDQAITERGG